MKKLFIAVLAVAALASCVKDEAISYNNKAIEFGDAYVANSTKAIYEGSNEVQDFQVWGTVTPDGATESVALYNGANVTRDGKEYNEAWTCDVQRFWTPDCDYAFYAVVDAAAENAVSATNGVPTSIAYTADGKTDLLYGATTKTTKTGLAQPEGGSLVAFRMQHLLSKITLKVTNPESNGDYSYNVKSISVSGAYVSGTYTFADATAANTNSGTWVGSGAMSSALSFDATTTALASGATHTPTNAYVIIPGDPKLTITIVTETVFGGKVVSPEKTHTLTVNSTAEDTDVTFVKNYHYNFAVTLPAPGAEIQLTIGSVGGFETDGDVTIN